MDVAEPDPDVLVTTWDLPSGPDTLIPISSTLPPTDPT